MSAFQSVIFLERISFQTFSKPLNADDLLIIAADKAFHSQITKYEFYTLGVELLISQRGSKPLTQGHNAFIRAKSYDQRWIAETSYPKRSARLAMPCECWVGIGSSVKFS